jgi:hypothetical protein
MPLRHEYRTLIVHRPTLVAVPAAVGAYVQAAPGRLALAVEENDHGSR